MKKLIIPFMFVAVLVMGATVRTGNRYLILEETTDSVARDGQLQLWTTSNNDIKGRTGDGVIHIIHNEAFSSLWYHGPAVTTTIGTQNTYTQITTFLNEGPEDDNGNVVGDATTDDDMTINLTGIYVMDIQCTLTNDGGGGAEFHIGLEVILNTAKTITNATNATPIVVTSAGHGLKTGDGVTQSGVVTNTNANGDFVITSLTDDTYSLQDLAHTDIVGNGAYGGGGTVTSVMPGNIMMERIVSNVSLGRGAANGKYALFAGDVLECYVANQDGTDNVDIEQIQFGASRIGE